MLKNDEDGTINLRGGKEEEVEFRINHVEEDESEAHQDREIVGKVNPISNRELENVASQTYSKVMVKFDKFVNLVATHAYEEIFDKYREEDVIISTDLLTDLANAHEEKSDKKMPVMFLGGIILGAIVMWILLRT